MMRPPLARTGRAKAREKRERTAFTLLACSFSPDRLCRECLIGPDILWIWSFPWLAFQPFFFLTHSEHVSSMPVNEHNTTTSERCTMLSFQANQDLSESGCRMVNVFTQAHLRSITHPCLLCILSELLLLSGLSVFAVAISICFALCFMCCSLRRFHTQATVRFLVSFYSPLFDLILFSSVSFGQPSVSINNASFSSMCCWHSVTICMQFLCVSTTLCTIWSNFAIAFANSSVINHRRCVFTSTPCT